MTPLENWLPSAVVWSIGWPLLHSLWQGLLVAGGLMLVLRVLKNKPANVHYAASFGALLLMALVPLATLVLAYAPAQRPAGVRLGSSHSDLVPSGSAGAPTPSMALRADRSTYSTARPGKALLPLALRSSDSTWRQRLLSHLSARLPWIVVAWLCGVAVLSVRLLAGWLLVQRWRRSGAREAAERWRQNVARIGQRLRVTRPVRLLESALVEVPTVIGCLRPVILLPAVALTGLTSEQLEAILAHELAHIRRHDYLANLIQNVIGTLLFYHPAVWWVSRRVRMERENCCDDLAVTACGNALVYARGLAELEGLRGVPVQVALTATGGQLLRRVWRLLGRPEPHKNVASWSAGALVMISFVVGAMGSWLTWSAHAAQPSDAPNIPYASSHLFNAAESRENDAREKGLETRVEDLSARLKKARAAGEDVALMEQELAAAEAELDALVHLPKELIPFHEHMVQRMDEIEGLVPSRYDPEPISVEAARQLRGLFCEDMGHPDINQRWQEYLVSVEIDEAACHPDISREAAKELRDALIEVYNGDRVYYNDSDVLLSVRFMGDLAAALYRVADPGDAEARQIADHLTERTLAWAEMSQDEHVITYYGRKLGDLQEGLQLMDEAVPDWLETELQSARDPETTRKLKRLEDAVLKTKESARRDTHNVERIKEVVAYGQADYGKPDWNASMLRMQLVFIRTVLSKPKGEVPDESVQYLRKTLRDLALSGRINDRELWTLWGEAVRALYCRAEVLWDVKMNRELAETDFANAEARSIAISRLLRSYAVILHNSLRPLPKETIAFIDRHLLELAMEEPQQSLVSEEHWIAWALAAGALGPERVSDDMKRFVRKMKAEEKDATRRGEYQRAWRLIRSASEERGSARPATVAPTTTAPVGVPADRA